MSQRQLFKELYSEDEENQQTRELMEKISYQLLFNKMTSLLDKMEKATSDNTLLFYTTHEVELPREREYPYYLDSRYVEAEDMEITEVTSELSKRHIEEYKNDFKELLDDPKTTNLRVKMHLLDFHSNILQPIYESHNTWSYTGWKMLHSSPMGYFADHRPARTAERLIKALDRDMREIDTKITSLQAKSEEKTKPSQ